jgi:hypothetical protein
MNSRRRVNSIVRRLVVFMNRTLMFAAIASVLLSMQLTFGQPTVENPVIVPSRSSGETTSAEIDRMAVENQRTPARLFVIIRLGNGETSRRIARNRLIETRQYLSQKDSAPTRTVYAEGERTSGEGRIEFYLAGALRLVVLCPRNKMPNLTCCQDYVPLKRRRTNRWTRAAGASIATSLVRRRVH